MKRCNRAAIAIAAFIVLAFNAAAIEEAKQKDAVGEPTAEGKASPKGEAIYQPPRRGAPRERVGGGVRGGLQVPEPTALVPDHVGFTSQGSPSLFWQIDRLPDSDVRVFFALIDLRSRKTIVETELERPAKAGIQRLRLSNLGVILQVGVEYEWSIALVSDMDRRSHDWVTTGYLERVADADPAPRGAGELAGAGLWYDALEELSNRVDAQPKDPLRLAQRNALLLQVGLEAPAP